MRSATVAAILLMAVLSARAQSPSSAAFEVTSIKPSAPGAKVGGIRPTPGQFTAVDIATAKLIAYAYGVREHQLVGGPGWLHSDRYDVIGKYATPDLRTRDMEMLRTALENRFKLRAHREMRQGPVYSLVVARRDGQLGPHLRRSPVDCATLKAAQGKPGQAESVSVGPLGEIPPCGAIQLSTGSGLILRANNRTSAQLAGMLSDRVGRTVVDRTGLTGEFDVELAWSVSFDINRGTRDETVSLLTAVDEQLGLKLESTRGPTDVLVIDSIERPSPD